MSNLYKAVVRSTFMGEHFATTLWYKSVLEQIEVVDWVLNAAEALANSIHETVVDAWQGQVPSDYVFTDIDIYPFNALFEPIFTAPYHMALSDVGELSGAGAWCPTGTVVNMKFNLGQTGFTAPWNRPPVSSYIAFSPVPAGHVDDGHQLDQSVLAQYTAIASLFCEPLPWEYINVDIPILGWEIGVGYPGAFVPVRAKVRTLQTPEIVGGDTFTRWIAWAPIMSCNPVRELGHRRSRQNAG